MERSGDLPSDPLNFFWAGEQYKKEMLVDGQTHLVLIREEAGAPDAKVRHGGSGDSRLTRVSIGHRSIPWLARGPSEWYLE